MENLKTSLPSRPTSTIWPIGAVLAQLCVEPARLHRPSTPAHASVKVPVRLDPRSLQRYPPCSPPRQVRPRCPFSTEEPPPRARTTLIHYRPWAIIEAKSLYSSSLFPLPLHLCCSPMCCVAPPLSTITDEQPSQVPHASPSAGLLCVPSRLLLRTIQSHPVQSASLVARTSRG
jgi:hypothetical protein